MEAPQLWDISPTISVGIPVWPGDTPFEAAPTWQIGNGCPVHVSRMTMSTPTWARTPTPPRTTTRKARASTRSDWRPTSAPAA